ncbi:Type 1 glutamine amidotransferase-like domain-containing protein [Kineococcus aurantiacus]|uniref:Dipeptidase E n=1 Tax=Kineococcus aurantiacus TaxID=37633 RepID=A0A7Y9DKX4_9ACTN|nr:dipeptidase E [Kineococcus aurantiacus]
MAGIHLGGGGSEDDEAALWNEVFTPGQRVSLWPFAVPPGPARDRTVRWFTGALRPRGRFTVDAWGVDGSDRSDRDTDRSAERLRRSDVVAVPGGNTFDLLHHLQRHDLLGALGAFLDGGGRVYGGSAGAVLLGADTAVAATQDADRVGVRDTRGLDRLAGAVVRPHHDPAQDAELQRWATTRRQVVLALPERSGVVVEGTAARNVGPGTVHVFGPAGRRARPAGATWDLREP